MKNMEKDNALIRDDSFIPENDHKKATDETKFYETEPGPEQEVLDLLMQNGIGVITIFSRLTETPYIARLREVLEKRKHPDRTPEWRKWVQKANRAFFDELYSEEYFSSILNMEFDTVIRDGVQKQKDIEGPYFNVVNGERRTHYQPLEYDRTIYFFGPCCMFGLYSEDKNTIESHLQKKLNERGERIRVVNCGMLAFNCEMVVRICSTDLKRGDIIVIYDPTAGLKGNAAIDIVKAMDEKNMPITWYWDSLEHVNHHAHNFWADEVLDVLIKTDFCKKTIESDSVWNGNTRQESDICQTGSRFKKTGVEDIREDESLSTFIDFKKVRWHYRTRYYVSKYHDDIFMNGKTGAIVMNCNPFTYGHRHLIEYASSRVDNLIIFVVEEDASLFSFPQRFAMVKDGTKDIPNVHVLPSGSFILSYETFPGYFSKVIDEDSGRDAEEDIFIFANAIAPSFNISVRFAGEEPLDPVTRSYNDAMRKVLTEHGIEFVEIPRIKDSECGKVISASRVRKALEKGDYAEAERLSPVISVANDTEATATRPIGNGH
ncbi:MAG: adenylyltransferase/cytidyltransferase family protein [Eubacteriales bacterium]|nr:adenylyltransferase/cytidyltransferase family protein [Eubacteriales bacterium]